MSLGLGAVITKETIDARAGNAALAVNQAFEVVKLFKAWLDTVPDATLQAAPFSYTSGEVAQLRSAFSDLDQLRTIYEGAATLAVAKDFRTFAKLVFGFGF